MFEKEADEFQKQIQQEYLDLGKNGAYPPLWERIGELWKKGAEFGYNKANEWHYPSKGEYPKECENVWSYCRGAGIKFCCVGHTIVNGDNKIKWWANNKTEELRVIAWKEIVLPDIN